MKKSTRIATALTTVALAAAVAQPITRIIDGTVAAGAGSSTTLGTQAQSFEGTLGAVLFHTSTATPTGTVSLLLTRPGSYTNAAIYSKALTNQQDHVAFIPGGFGLFKTDTLTVTNTTGDSVDYSVSVTK